MEPSERQQIVDGEHLRILGICYYVSGGLSIFWSSFVLLYVAFGLALAIGAGLAAHKTDEAIVASVIGAVVAIVGLFILLIGWTLGGLSLYVGRALGQRRYRTLTLVVAAVHCLWIPIGTLLGIFTFVVLLRPSVMRLYDEHAQ